MIFQLRGYELGLGFNEEELQVNQICFPPVSLKALLCAVRMYTEIILTLNRELVFNWYEPVS